MHIILIHIAELQNVIRVNNNTGIKQIKKNLIPYPLKYTWATYKPNLHNEELKCTIPTRKNYLVYIFFSNKDMEIPIPRI